MMYICIAKILQFCKNVMHALLMLTIDGIGITMNILLRCINAIHNFGCFS